MKLHIICYALNHKFKDGEEWGEVRNTKDYSPNLQTVGVVALIFAKEIERQMMFEVRTPTPDYPNDLHPEADKLIGIFSNQKTLLQGIEDYYNEFAEKAQNKLVSQAAGATEHFSEDELEEFANKSYSKKEYDH